MLFKHCLGNNPITTCEMFTWAVAEFPVKTENVFFKLKTEAIQINHKWLLIIQVPQVVSLHIRYHRFHDHVIMVPFKLL